MKYGVSGILARLDCAFYRLPGILGNCVYEECKRWNGMPEGVEGMFVKISTSAGKRLEGLEFKRTGLRVAISVRCHEILTYMGKDLVRKYSHD